MKYRRFFFEIAYDGTAYSGWQRQINALTVQEVIEKALTRLLGTDYISILGCGRTDAGVHASQYYFHADLNTEMNLESLKYKINHVLPPDIGVHSIIPTHPDAHARYDAISRSYTYHFHLDKDPMKRSFSTYYTRARGVDFGLLEATAHLISQCTDFAALSKSNSDVKTTTCHISESRWTRDERHSSYAYHITANRFLRGMVRLIVGASVQVATGKITLSALDHALSTGDKPYLLFSAPPQGLFLHSVRYPYPLEVG